jgi:hypothetical protein
MLTTVADRLNSTNAAVKWLKRKHPEEEVVFASAATILETNKAVPVGWSFQRLFQRRGVLILTRNQLVLKDSFFSLFTVFYLFVIIASLAMFLGSQEWLYLLFVIPSSALVLQRLPYQQQIPLNDIREVKLGSVRGITAKGSLFTVYLRDKAINIVPAQILPEEVFTDSFAARKLNGN